MEKHEEFQQYLEFLCEGLGHADRNTSLIDYCKGLMLPIERKSIEPLAAHSDPSNVQAKHQSLHHFVAKSDWSDKAILTRACQWATPALKSESGCYWIVDDTGIPKQGKHSVGVARQYCGQLGKQDNCQVAVSLSLATDIGSIPIDYRLYLPKEWTDDADRCKKAGVPEDVIFQTKPSIAMEQIRNAKLSNLPAGIVLADAGYGDDTEFRDAIREEGLIYAVGIKPNTKAWTTGNKPLPPKEWQGKGRKPTLLRRGPGHQPKSVKTIAMELSAKVFRKVTWREGTNKKLSSRFARIRVRPAHNDFCREEMRDEEWLIIEWPKDEKEPIKYWLSNLPVEISFEKMVHVIKMRWRIERDYEELKQEFGLAQFEGRNWRGFHHHGTLCIAAYTFLMTLRLKQIGSKKKWSKPETANLSKGYKPRGSRASSTACA
jgi:SRSO17 transposase